jgi:diguanylate cyclase (GGDEF)-like protein
LKLIEFDYAALSFVAPKQIVFRTRLEGLDDDWVYSGNETTASFRHLPPGKYVFQVQAANADGVWNPDGASYELAVELPIHETWYFKIGLVLTIVLVTMGLTVLWSRLRYIRLKNREAQLEKMVSQRTQDLREATLNDALTGLRNRRYISEVIIPELKAFANRRQYVHSNDSPRRSVEEQGVYGLFLIDIDHFKEVNDTYGHDAGDLLLSSFATVLRSLVRSDDIVVRWGGEEFLVILKNIDPTFLNTFAAKLLRRISSKSFEIGRTRKLKLSRTCSLGCANFPFIADQPTCFSFDQVLMLADLGLYESKNSGRNQGVRILTTGKAPDQEQIASLLSSLDYGRQHQFVTSNVVPGESVPE